jgi:hypothetical protein
MPNRRVGPDHNKAVFRVSRGSCRLGVKLVYQEVWRGQATCWSEAKWTSEATAGYSPMLFVNLGLCVLCQVLQSRPRLGVESVL